MKYEVEENLTVVAVDSEAAEVVVLMLSSLVAAGVLVSAAEVDFAVVVASPHQMENQVVHVVVENWGKAKPCFDPLLDGCLVVLESLVARYS